MITCKNVRAATIDSCFSLRSDHLLAFIARLKHTNSGKKASCARQNAAFTPRKSIRSTIIRYDIGFRTNNTQKTKNNMLGSARNGGKPGKIGRLHPSDVRFSTRIPVRKRSKQGQIGKNRPSTPFRCPFFHSNTGSETLETGANQKNRSLPFPDVVFPTKIPGYRVNNNYVNITEYVKLRYFL